MNLKSAIIAVALAALFLTATGNIAYCERTLYLSACQELVSMARSYQARAEAHNRIAKSYTMQIENLAKFPKNQGTIAAMDNFFSQYDENRKLESKYRELYRQATEEAKGCMKNID